MNYSFLKTAALIVTYNRLTKLKTCLQASCALPFDFIIVINNASSDGTKEWLKTLTDKRLKIFNLEKNTGGAGGFKYGVNYIVDSVDVDWVFCFDDDAYPDINLLNNFYKADKKDYQLFCSKVITPQGITCPMNIPYKKLPHNFITTLHYKLHTQKYLPTSTIPCEVESFSFVGVILHKDVLSQHSHAIIEDFFIYFDDLAFSHYLNTMGYKILYLPNLIFVHDIDSNSNIYSGRKIYYLVRNLIISHKIFNQKPLFTIPVIISRIIFISFLSFFKTHKKETLVTLFKAIRDGICYKPDLQKQKICSKKNHF